MRKEVLEEINRFRELVSLKPITAINEDVTHSVLSEQFAALKRMGLESIEKEIEAFMKSEAKELAIQEIKKGTATSYRAGAQGAKNIEKQTVEKVLQQIEKQGGRTLTNAEKLTLEQEIRRTMTEEIKQSINKTSKELAEKYAKEITKQPTKSGTWEAIKKHFGKHWKKYAAAGILAAIFAYFYPGETPPEEDEEEPVPPPVPEDGKYRGCPDLPFTKYCKNPKLKEIQECIGAEPDGYYGPETETKLKEKGYPTTITQEVYDKIIKNCRKTQVDVDGGSVEDNIITGTDV
jgi:hypothetical protein